MLLGFPAIIKRDMELVIYVVCTKQNSVYTYDYILSTIYSRNWITIFQQESLFKLCYYLGIERPNFIYLLWFWFIYQNHKLIWCSSVLMPLFFCFSRNNVLNNFHISMQLFMTWIHTVVSLFFDFQFLKKYNSFSFFVHI